MANAKDATECISNLHRTELHGRTISVERAKSDLGPPKTNGTAAATAKPSDGKASAAGASADKKKDDLKKPGGLKDPKDTRKPTIDDKSKDKKRDDMKASSSASSSTSKPERKRISPPRSDSKELERDTTKIRPRERPIERTDKPRAIMRPSPKRDTREILSFNKLREERERQRLRDKDRELREEERRRREIRRRQREEEERLIREREKLALERRRIEEAKAELLRIERERQKLERDKIELERLELKRQQRKYGYRHLPPTFSIHTRIILFAQS